MIDKLTPFNITLNGKTYNTGKIKLVLDPNAGTAASLTLDFDTMQATLVTDLLVDAPLLKKLKAPPTTIAATETGSFKYEELSQQKNTVVVAITLSDMTSSGSVSGGPFAGGLFRNRKRRGPTDCSYPANTVHSFVRVVLDPNGNVRSSGAVRSPNRQLFCAADDGVLEFQDQHINFTGLRNGDLAGK